MKAGDSMARRGGKSAGFWMIQRQNKEPVIDPDNPDNLPVFVLGGQGLLFNLTMTETFVLIIL